GLGIGYQPGAASVKAGQASRALRRGASGVLTGEIPAHAHFKALESFTLSRRGHFFQQEILQGYRRGQSAPEKEEPHFVALGPDLLFGNIGRAHVVSVADANSPKRLVKLSGPDVRR